ncbi:hypoxanthine guanine phosphoribosyltransferase [Coccidioides immitis H538.4]|uniref:Hypoxanthine guanine phosphoribosyltransferase n=1 Tax=Coccidioides immitis H538.4 TaxID=396776 RepID=A0A0J8UUV9_COCIT|nr:hypoxanthine guanine phosphoribosyltransferase [Coccidioides immitis H538.4]
MSEKFYVTYNQVHKLCQQSADRILKDFRPNLMIAIGGGGYVPARILRSFLKQPGAPNIPIQAIGLSLYEDLGKGDIEAPGTKVTRTQWLDMSSLEMANLIGKNVLIVDEVDNTRTILEYAVGELENSGSSHKNNLVVGREFAFSINVLHQGKGGTISGHECHGECDLSSCCSSVLVWFLIENSMTFWDIEEHDRLAVEHPLVS